MISYHGTIQENRLGVDNMENKPQYSVNIDDLNIETGCRGTVAELTVKIVIGPRIDDGITLKRDRTVLTKKISEFTEELQKTIDCINASDVIEKVVYDLNGEEIHYRNGKPVPKPEK